MNALEPRTLRSQGSPVWDIATANLSCALGLPGAEGLDIGRYDATLDSWVKHIRLETLRHAYRFSGHPEEYEHSPAYFCIPKENIAAFKAKIPDGTFCKFVVCGTDKQPGTIVAGPYRKGKRGCEHIVLSATPKVVCDGIWAAGQCLLCGNVIVINSQTGNYGGCNNKECLEFAKKRFAAAGFEVQFAKTDEGKTDITVEKCSDHQPTAMIGSPGGQQTCLCAKK